MQIEYTFDKETMKKIGKGLLLSMTGAAALAGLDYLGTIKIDNQLIALIVSATVPAFVNAVKEWMSGVEK